MDRLEAMKIFVRVVETGSFSAAARSLELSLASVSRQVAALERSLDVCLLARTTRRVAVTEAGRTYFERARRILGDLEETELELARSRATPSGQLVVSAPVLFGRARIAPLLPDFLRKHPAVRISLRLSDGPLDLIGDHIDVAVRIGELGESSLIARRLCTFTRVLCASPRYLRRAGEPGRPEELTQHECLAFTWLAESDVWQLRSGKETFSLPISGRLRSDSQGALIEAAKQGMGIILVAPWAVRTELESGRLRQILPKWGQLPTPVSATFTESRLLSAKTRVFVDYLAESLRD